MSKTRIQTLRMPIEMMEWLDEYAAIEAIMGKKRINRSQVILNFLDVMRSILLYQEQQSGISHHAEIKALIAKAKQQQQQGEQA